MTEKKPWLLQTAEERAGVESPHKGLLDDGLYSAMCKNKELRDEVKRLETNMEEAVRLISTLNAKIAILSTLQKHGTSHNPTPQPNPYLPDHRA